MIAEPTTDALAAVYGEAIGRSRVLVTGGAGVIAREVLERLSGLGAEVLSVDRLPLAFDVPAGTTHLQLDLAVDALDALERFRPDAILHLAATFERSVESAEFWADNWSDNVVATHRLAELAGRPGRVDAFVFASSYLVYETAAYLSSRPSPDGVALAEDARIRPRNLCGAAKLYGEAELEFVRTVGGAGYRGVSARIYRVYGRGSRDVVSRWVRAALDGEPIELYQPENRFDYVYSGDVAEGLIRMAFEPRAEGVINLATGTSRAVADVVAAIEAATGRPLQARDRTVDEPYEASRADTRRLVDALGWRPTVALEAGVARLVAFERGREPRLAGIGG